MTWRGTLALWSVVGALAAYLWFTQPPARHGAEPEPAGDTGPLLLDFRPEDVTALVVGGAEGGTLALRRDQSGWRDDRDLPSPASGLVETVLETLAGTRAIASIEDAPTNLVDYGLDPPQRSITIVTRRGQGQSQAAGGGRGTGAGDDEDGGKGGGRGSGAEGGEAAGSLMLLVGDRNPAWTGVYARVPPADRVVLIGSVLSWELDKLVGAARQAGGREEGEGRR